MKSERNEEEVKRVPLHKQNVLIGLTRDGFQRGWVFECDIARYGLAGWTIVEDPDAKTHDGQIYLEGQLGTAVTRMLNKGYTCDADKRNSVLMEIPIELYKEDYMHEQNQIAANEKLVDATGELAKHNNVYGSVEISHN